MKVGILTYHRALNYGAVWQSYALKEFLISKGYDVQIIDYWPEYHAQQFKLIPRVKWKDLKGFDGWKRYLFDWVNLMLAWHKIKQRRCGFQRFIKNSLGIEGPIKFNTIQALQDLPLGAIICGSDQIWRYWRTPGLTGFDLSYFAAFNFDGLKISYAASMGKIEGIERNKVELCASWKSFDSLSVREASLKELVRSVCGVDPSLVLDPVMLPKKAIWDRIMPATKIQKQPFILFYHLMRSSEALEFVDALSKKKGLPVYEIHGGILFKYKGERFRYTASSPEQLLGLFRDASIVVSTSFHGVAMSVVFEKEFYAMGMGDKADRAKTLLDSLDLSERYVSNHHKNESFKPIVWENHREKREILRHQSECFLIQALEEKP